MVYDVRGKRRTDTFFKHNTALTLYRVMKTLDTDPAHNYTGYHPMSHRALDALTGYHETNSFLRGIVPFIGFHSSTVTYERHERFTGKPKYPLKKMIFFTFDSITSFGVEPLKIVANLGVLASVLSIFGLLYVLTPYLTGNAIVGWTAIVCSVWLLGGVQLLCIGVLSDYIGRIYNEVKNRPRHLTEKGPR